MLINICLLFIYLNNIRTINLNILTCKEIITKICIESKIDSIWYQFETFKRIVSGLFIFCIFI